MPIILALWEAKTSGSLELINSRPVGKLDKAPSLKKKIQKISQAWWRMPVIPATREAETGVSLEPGK